MFEKATAAVLEVNLFFCVCGCFVHCVKQHLCHRAVPLAVALECTGLFSVCYHSSFCSSSIEIELLFKCPDLALSCYCRTMLAWPLPALIHVTQFKCMMFFRTENHRQWQTASPNQSKKKRWWRRLKRQNG